jgi:hypothetical protein
MSTGRKCARDKSIPIINIKHFLNHVLTHNPSTLSLSYSNLAYPSDLGYWLNGMAPVPVSCLPNQAMFPARESVLELDGHPHDCARQDATVCFPPLFFMVYLRQFVVMLEIFSG